MKVLKGGLFHEAMRHFRTLPGVVGLGSGFKTTHDGRSEVPALCVIVRHKRPLKDVPLAERIPAYFDGVLTDVVEPLITLPAGSANTALIGGAGIQVDSGASGTLGCFATIDNGSTQVMLTAGHVLTSGAGVFGAGGEVGSPELKSSWCCASGVVAKILRGRIDDQLDCGIATLSGSRPAQQVVRGLGPDSNGDNTDLLMGIAALKPDPTTQIMSPLIRGDKVRKVGASTGLTHGVVSRIDFELNPFEDLPPIKHQIVIEPLENQGHRMADGRDYFTLPGDSGAVVVNEKNEIAALLIRAADFSNQGPPSWMGFGGGVTDIHKVIAELGINIYKSPLPPATQPIRGLRAGLPIHRAPDPTPDILHRRGLIDVLKRELETFALGKKFVRFVQTHEQELSRLVNHDRRVTVAWHRAHGPAFLAMLLKELRGIEQPIPRTVEGLPIETGLASVHAAVQACGSAELVTDMAALWPAVSASLSGSPTVGSVIDKLRGIECHE